MTFNNERTEAKVGGDAGDAERMRVNQHRPPAQISVRRTRSGAEKRNSALLAVWLVARGVVVPTNYREDP
jgi:hypothetical protein